MINNAVAEAPDFPQGLPIYDCRGTELGTVSALGVQSTYLVMRTGWLFHHDVSIPLSAIQRSDGQGVYLTRTRQEIRNLTLGGWSSLGNVDLNTGVAAGADLGGSPDLFVTMPSAIPSAGDTASDANESRESQAKTM